MTLKELKQIILENNNQKPKNKNANQPLLYMINLINNDNATIVCERASSKSNMVNRGSAMECLIKLWILEGNEAIKGVNQYEADIVYNGIKYEVKYSSPIAYAHYNPKQDLSNLIFADTSGIYVSFNGGIVLDKCGKHIKTINKDNALKVLSF